MTPQKGTGVTKTIRELREERGQSRQQLAAAIGVIPEDVAAWEMGKAEPTVSRLRALTEHFGVRDDQIDLRPGHSRSLTERLTDALGGGT
jgi:transcriptional regulator with XRE-family HTH domain